MSLKRITSLWLACLLLWLPLLSGGVVAAENENIPVIVGVDVQVKADFTARFYIRVSEKTTEAGVYYKGERLVGEPLDDGRFVVSVPYIFAPTMSEYIVVEPYAVIGTSSNLRGSAYRFSLMDYATRLLAKGDLTPEARAMLVAMLNFGAACQRADGYYPHNLPNAYLTEEEQRIPEREYESVFALLGEGEGSEGYYPTMVSIVFLDAVVFRFGFVIGGLDTAEDAYMEISDDPTFATAATYPLTAAGKDQYSATTDGIYLNSLSKTYYIRVVTPDGVSRPIAYSAESYGHEIFRPDSAITLADEAKTFVHAMMAFGDALLAYEASLAS